MSGEELQQRLGQLLGDGGAWRVLDVDLPPGSLVAPEESGGRFWLSDEPASADLWVRLHQAHPRSGLWPVFFNESLGTPGLWVTGTLPPRPLDRIDGLDAGGVLEGFWREWLGDDELDDDDLAVLAPFGRIWPGLAPARDVAEDPDEFADRYVRDNDDGTSRIMLVPVARSADLLTAVLRSWEDRFGARVVEIGFDVLNLTVAGPPVTDAHAEHVAAEHNAFDRDVVAHFGTIGEYAAYAVQGKSGWSFWWD